MVNITKKLRQATNQLPYLPKTHIIYFIIKADIQNCRGFINTVDFIIYNIKNNSKRGRNFSIHILNCYSEKTKDYHYIKKVGGKMKYLIRKCIAVLLIAAMSIGIVPIQVLAAAPVAGGIIINGGNPVIAHPGEVLRVVVEQLPVSQGNQTMMVANSDASARFYYNFHTLVGYGSVIFTRPVQTQGRPDSETVTFMVDEQGKAVFYIYISRDTDYGSTFSLYFDFTTCIPTTVYVTERGPEQGDGPSIRILTEIPSGPQDFTFIDIEYIAIPSPGAVITEVAFTRNGGAYEFLYIGYESGFTPRGELGSGRLFISTFETDIEFIVRDSAGHEGTYALSARPWYDFGVPEPVNWDWATSSGGCYYDEHLVFATNRLRIFYLWEQGATSRDIEAIALERGWRVTERTSVSVTVKLPRAHTEAELEALVAQLENDYPRLISRISISRDLCCWCHGYYPNRVELFPMHTRLGFTEADIEHIIQGEDWVVLEITDSSIIVYLLSHVIDPFISVQHLRHGVFYEHMDAIGPISRVPKDPADCPLRHRDADRQNTALAFETQYIPMASASQDTSPPSETFINPAYGRWPFRGFNDSYNFNLCAAIAPDAWSAAGTETRQTGEDIVCGRTQQWEWRHIVEDNWNLNFINVPCAWAAAGTETRPIRVGIIDSGVKHTHEFLNIPARNIFEQPPVARPNDRNHGTRVMGTITSISSARVMMPGTADGLRYELFSYQTAPAPATGDNERRIAHLTQETIRGLRWNIINGAQVINQSQGIGIRGDSVFPQHLNDLADYMNTYLNRGYDFVITVSAGNDSIDAYRNHIFAALPDINLRNRIIVVGSSHPNGEIYWNSNFGNRIDVVAPGFMIYTAHETGTGWTRHGGMTSDASPHVAGIAALAWSTNPGLTGSRIKRNIVEAAEGAGRQIWDTRSLWEYPLNANIPHYYYFEVCALRTVELAQADTRAHRNGHLTGFVTRFLTDEQREAGELFGTPIGGATVELFEAETSRRWTFTDTARTGDNIGRFYIENITPGYYYLTITHDNFVPETTEPFFISAGVTANLHTLELLPAGNRTINTYLWEGMMGVAGHSMGFETASYGEEHVPFTGTVTLEVRRRWNFISLLPGELIKTVEATGGRHEMTLPAGFYFITVTAEGFLSVTQPAISMGGAQPLNLDFVLYREPVEELTVGRIVLEWEGTQPIEWITKIFMRDFSDGGNDGLIYSWTYDDSGVAQWPGGFAVSLGGSFANRHVNLGVNSLPDGFYRFTVMARPVYVIPPVPANLPNFAVVRIYNEEDKLIRTIEIGDASWGGAGVGPGIRPGMTGPGLNRLNVIWNVFSLRIADGQATIGGMNNWGDITFLMAEYPFEAEYMPTDYLSEAEYEYMPTEAILY